MSEILAVLLGENGHWLILDCGHWYKWTGASPPPEAGTDLRCPGCAPISVVSRS